MPPLHSARKPDLIETSEPQCTLSIKAKRSPATMGISTNFISRLIMVKSNANPEREVVCYPFSTKARG